MISSNALSTYLLQHNQIEIYDQNFSSIQDTVRLDNPDGSKFKGVCTYFPNLAVLTKSKTPGDIQVTYVHVPVGNKSLGEMVPAFSLEVSLEAPTVILIVVERTFYGNGEKIHIPTMKVFLCSTTINLEKSKKICDWESMNAVIIPPFLAKVVITNG